VSLGDVDLALRMAFERRFQVSVVSGQSPGSETQNLKTEAW
jgi:hypothetical protein